MCIDWKGKGKPLGGGYLARYTCKNLLSGTLNTASLHASYISIQAIITSTTAIITSLPCSKVILSQIVCQVKTASDR